jgi:hypothetical protein
VVGLGALSARDAVNCARTAWVEVMRVVRDLRSEEEGAMVVVGVFCSCSFFFFLVGVDVDLQSSHFFSHAN